jgi:hypothetical protein
MTSLKAYQPDVDAKLQAAADMAADTLHDIINDLHDYEEASIDGPEEEDRAYSTVKA